MAASECDSRAASVESGGLEQSAEVVELVLLLHRDQLSALERLARERDISVARLLRQMIGNFLARESEGTSVSEARPGANSHEEPRGSQSETT